MTTKCYGIDGTPYATNDRYIPCNATAVANGGSSACCAPGDVCLSNGFCQSAVDDQAKKNLFWRNGCTDPTWNSPACAKVCNGLDQPDTHAVYYCLQQNSWCCPTGPINTGPLINTTCCNNTDLTFSAANPIVYTTANVGNFVSTMRASATPVSLQSQTTNRASTATGSQSTSSSSGNSDTTTSFSGGTNTAAIAVGVTLGVLLAIALGVIAWLVLKNKKLKQGTTQHELPATTAAYVQPHYQNPQQEKPMEYPVQQQQPQQPYAQLGNTYRPNELPHHEVAHEVQGSTWRQ